MANENIFTTKADAYAHSRPSYAPEAIEKVFSTMIFQGDYAADIGSGTGIFSREFLKRGYHVFCVEPNEAMRAQAESVYADNVFFHSIPAPAEHTGLMAHSVSLITAASAFHWFDTQLFYQECKRILKPNGIVCLIANARTYDDFTQKHHALCTKYCHPYTSLTHGIETVYQKADAFFKGSYHIERYAFPLQYSKKSFLSRSLSSSYAPEKGTQAYEAYIRALQILLDETFAHEEIRIANDTVMLWGKLN